jgi:hypothetical protein
VPIPSIVGKTLGANGDDCLEVYFWFDAGSNFNSRTNSLGQQSGTFDIAQVQLEEGAVATAFEQRHRGQELSLCQRYYLRQTVSSIAMANNVVSAYVSFPVEMRSVPTPVVNSCDNGTANSWDYNAGFRPSAFFYYMTSRSLCVSGTPAGSSGAYGTTLRLDAEL